MRRTRRAVTVLDRAAPLLAIALAALLLAACTGGTGGSATPGRAGKPGFRQVNFAEGHGGPGQARVFIIGPVGGPGAVISVNAGGPAGSSGRPHISLPPIPPADSAAAIALPLDSYENVSVQEQAALAAAGDLLTQRCMIAAGFSYPVAAQPGAGVANVQFVEDGGYGVASLTQAEAFGYKQPSLAGPGGPLGALPAFVPELHKHGQAWTSALLGFVPGARASARPREGCLQAADTALYGKIGSNPDPDPVPAIAFQAAQWTQSDPHVLAVEPAWRAVATPTRTQRRRQAATGRPHRLRLRSPSRWRTCGARRRQIW